MPITTATKRETLRERIDTSSPWASWKVCNNTCTSSARSKQIYLHLQWKWHILSVNSKPKTNPAELTTHRMVDRLMASPRKMTSSRGQRTCRHRFLGMANQTIPDTLLRPGCKWSTTRHSMRVPIWDSNAVEWYLLVRRTNWRGTPLMKLVNCNDTGRNLEYTTWTVGEGTPPAGSLTSVPWRIWCNVT